MAALQKMSILGIRSFSPTEEQTIEFYSPLTMIVGANGCGKTTIIECLKYACTGSLPPNVRLGQNFINDPSITDSQEVKGSIKLKFKTKSGSDCVAIRQLSVTKKKTKLEFKALDGVVKTIDSSGRKVSMSVKCAELDKQVPEMMGVSSAIMENVIFCHQEDSNWPMMEGAILKKKFDDVFESTRYAKALEAYAKTKKDFASKAKDLKGELMELNAHLSAANETEEELQVCIDQQQQTQSDSSLLSNQIESIDEAIANSRATVERLNQEIERRREMQWKVKEAEKRIDEMAKKMEQILVDSDDDLRTSYENFENETKERAGEVQRLQNLVDKLNREIMSAREEINVLNTKKGKAEMIDVQKKSSIKNQLSIIQLCCNKYSMPSVPSDDEGSVQDFIRLLYERINKMTADFESNIMGVRANVARHETLYNDVRNDINRQELSIDLKLTEIKNMNMECDRKRAEIRDLDLAGSVHDQVKAKNDYEEYKAHNEKSYEHYQEKCIDYRNKIKEYVDEISKITEDYHADADLLSHMSMNMTEITLQQAEETKINKEDTEIEMDRVRIKQTYCHDLFSTIALPETVAAFDPVISTIYDLVNDRKRQIAVIKEQEKAAAIEITGHEAVLQEKQKSIASKLAIVNAQGGSEKKASLTHILNAITELRMKRPDEYIDDYNPQDVRIYSVDDDITVIGKMIEDTCNMISSTLAVYAAFKEVNNTASSNLLRDNACVCCKRSIDTKLLEVCRTNVRGMLGIDTSYIDINSFVIELTRHKQEACNLLDQFKQHLTNYPENVGLKAEIRKVEDEVKALNSRKAVAMNIESNCKKNVLPIESELQSFEVAYKDIVDITKRWKANQTKKASLEDRKRAVQSQSTFSLAYGNTNRSYDAINDEQKERISRKEDLQTRKDRVVSEEAAYIRRYNNEKILLNDKEKLYTSTVLKAQKFNDANNLIKSLVLRSEACEQERRAAASGRDASAIVLSERESVLRSAKLDLQAQEDAHRLHISDIQSSYDELKRLKDTIARSSDGELNLQDITHAIDVATYVVVEKEGEVSKLIPRINDITLELSSQGRRRRIVQDNIDYRVMIEQKKKLVASMHGKEATSSTSEADLEAARRLLDRKLQDRQKKVSEYDRLSGQVEIFVSQEKALRVKLNGPQYKNIAARYRRKNIEFETTNMAVADLGTYYDALDTALQTFHSKKLAEINKIIRELWQQIYKGQDIEIIQLESGVDPASVGKASKSYNYRVVMQKGTVTLDMRGRCSAGQRVLASIVIRLALAETFCLNCGILALDEPTTNLDESNKVGLAYALARIIFNRKKQQNFQLICITHDEEFVRVMKEQLAANTDFSTPEHYFRVSREEDEYARFFSRIERINWEDM